MQSLFGKFHNSRGRAHLDTGLKQMKERTSIQHSELLELVTAEGGRGRAYLCTLKGITNSQVTSV